MVSPSYYIRVYLDDSPVLHTKGYSSYQSSTRECRIGGMREWFKKKGIKSGDEIVIQLLDKKNYIYRIMPQGKFIAKTRDLQSSFDTSQNEQEAEEKLTSIVRWTATHKRKVVFSEFKRLIDTMYISDRNYSQKRVSSEREITPASIRILLEAIYQGHCQVCDFWFLKKDNSPFFEVHHLNPLKGHHPKNLVVVCGNCHNQFEYANVHNEFNDEEWLIRVSFNRKTYSVTQALLEARLKDSVKELFVL